MLEKPRFALVAALLLGAVAPALAQAPPSSAQQKADNDRIIDNAVRSTQRDISRMQNQLETQHLESQQRFQCFTFRCFDDWFRFLFRHYNFNWFCEIIMRQGKLFEMIFINFVENLTFQ